MMDIQKLRMNKKGLFTGGNIEKVIVGVIGVVILFQLVAALIPSLFDAGDAINASGIQFGSFFASDGLIWLVLAAGLLIYVVKMFMGGKGKAKY